MKVTTKTVQDRITILQNLKTISINEEFQLACLRNLLAHMTSPTETDAEIKAQRDALAAENAVLREACGGDGAYLDCPACTHSQYVEAPETPATDAYLNSVRAEGVEKAAEYLFEEKDIGAYEHECLTAFAAQFRSGEPS